MWIYIKKNKAVWITGKNTYNRKHFLEFDEEIFGISFFKQVQ